VQKRLQKRLSWRSQPRAIEACYLDLCKEVDTTGTGVRGAAVMIARIDRRAFVATLGGAAAAVLLRPREARAQQSDRLRLIGVQMGPPESDQSAQSRLATFRDVLAKLGWTEGNNLRIELRWGGGDPALFGRNAAELIALGPAVLLADSTAALEALRQTRTIPIVFVGVTDPIGQGFVANLAHPGGNITGFSAFDSEMAGKWLEMLTQITPPAERVRVLFDPATAPYAGLMLREIEQAASSLAVVTQAAPCHDDAEVEAVMAGLAHEDRGGLLVLASVFTVTHRKAIIALAARYRIPAVYSFPFFAAEGGMMSYGVDLDDLFRRAAAYVDRILKGDRPGDLPVQNPTKFDLVINLKAAKALDITIAPSLLATAAEVIE
jgi:putative tryptophan/tyrosine transport system substrate-binding protein